jgi:hypothetical protein
MSRLVMLSDETGLRAYAGVAPGPLQAVSHRIDYRACKDVAGRANTVETRHLIALGRINSALPSVPIGSEWHGQSPGTGAGNYAVRSGLIAGRGWKPIDPRP